MKCTCGFLGHSVFGCEDKRSSRRSKAKLSVLGLAAASVLFAGVASAQGVFHLVDSSSDGANLGTAADPFHSIRDAVAVVQAGDQVIVHGDTAENPRLYEERVDLGASSASGSDGQRIVFRAYPPHSVTMYGFETGDMDYVTIAGFQITIPEWLIEEEWQAKYALFIESDYVEVRHNNFIEIPGAAIRSDDDEPFPTGGFISNNYIYHTGMGMVIFGNDWLIEGNEIERLVYNPLTDFDADYTRAFGNNITFRKNYFHGTDEEEVGGSHTDGFQTFAIGAYMHGLTIDSNIVIDFDQGVIMEATNGPGTVSDVTICNNVFDAGSFGGAYGVVAKYEITNLRVDHNLVANIDNHGVYFRFGAAGSIQNNIFFNAGSNYRGDEESSVEGGYNLIDREGYPYHSEDGDLLEVDPMFVDEGNWAGQDGVPFTADDGFKLWPESPAIDAGIEVAVLSDLFGNARPHMIGAGVDMGPYEALQIDTTGCAAAEDGSSSSSPLSGDVVLLGLVVFPFFRSAFRRIKN